MSPDTRHRIQTLIDGWRENATSQRESAKTCVTVPGKRVMEALAMQHERCAENLESILVEMIEQEYKIDGFYGKK